MALKLIKKSVKSQGLVIANSRKLQFCDRQEKYFRELRQQSTICCQQPFNVQRKLHVRGNHEFAYYLLLSNLYVLQACCQKFSIQLMSPAPQTITLLAGTHSNAGFLTKVKYSVVLAVHSYYIIRLRQVSERFV